MSTMEALYAKLYDKYTKLKTKKFLGLENLNKDQEIKFVTYVDTAEELIQYLRNENENLKAQVNDLRSEMASIRSTEYEQCTEYQNLLLEENRKTKELSEEVERLQKLQQVGNLSRVKGIETGKGGLCTPASGPVSGAAGNHSQKRKTNKRRRNSQSETEDIDMPSSSHQDETPRESENNLRKEPVSSGALITFQQSQCCRTIELPGAGVNPTGQANCLFQMLLEYLVNLKFTTVSQTEEICISAVHQSSGYSFSLTWVKRAAEKEAELLYRVLSMGTFERVAPEWMKDSIMFSTTMCPLFFERLSRVVKGHT